MDKLVLFDVESLILAEAIEKNKGNKSYLKSLFDNRNDTWNGIEAFAFAIDSDDLAESDLECLAIEIGKKLTSISGADRLRGCRALSNLFKNIGETIFKFFRHIFWRLLVVLFDNEALVQDAAKNLNEALKECAKTSSEFRNIARANEFTDLISEVPEKPCHEVLVEWILIAVRSTSAKPFPSGALVLFRFLNVLKEEMTVKEVMRACCDELRSSQLNDLIATVKILVENIKGIEDTRSWIMLYILILEVLNFSEREIVEVYGIIMDALLHMKVQHWKKASAFSYEGKEVGDLINKLQTKISQVPDEKLTEIMGVSMRYIKPEYAESAREAAVTWISLLVGRIEDMHQRNQGIDIIIQSLFDLSDEAQVRMLKNSSSFNDDIMEKILRSLFSVFRNNTSIIAGRGKHIIHILCVAKKDVFIILEIAKLLQEESDLDLVDNVVQVLDELLLDSPHFAGIREILRSSDISPASTFAHFFTVWSHLPGASIGLCLIAEKYQLAGHIIGSLLGDDQTKFFFDQIEHLVHHIDGPIFSNLRFEFVRGQDPWSLEVICLLIMLLQSRPKALRKLKNLFSSIPSFSITRMRRNGLPTDKSILELHEYFMETQDKHKHARNEKMKMRIMNGEEKL